MTREPTTDGPEPEVNRPASLSRLRAAVALPDSGVVLASALALAAVAASTAVRVLSNLPFDPAVASPAVRTATAVAATLAPAVALATVALTDERPTVRVGLLFAAVFGCLAVAAPTATLPAVVAVAVGGALALAGTLGAPTVWSYGAVRRRAIAVGFALAVAVSLGSSTGVLGGARSLGSLLALGSLAAVGTRSERSPLAVGAGLVAVGALVAASAAAPFVLGSVLLVGAAVTGVPHVLVAVAVGGGVAAVVAGLHRGAYGLAVGAGLLLAAGVPVTFPRSMAVLLGATLVVLDVTDGAASRPEVTR